MRTVPFNYMTEGGYAFCPKCSSKLESERNIDRTICDGGFFQRFFGYSRVKGCPEGEHFHRDCTYCKAKWIEETYENSQEGAMAALMAAFESAEKIKMSEEDIVKEWRLRSVRAVHES